MFKSLFKKSCNCGSCSSENVEEKKVVEKKEGVMTIKILGTGCKNCVSLTENVKVALKEMKLEANIEKVTNLEEISSYGIMSTPGLVIDKKVVSYGKVLKIDEIVKIIKNYIEQNKF